MTIKFHTTLAHSGPQYGAKLALRIGLLGLLALSLPACTGVQNALGLSKSAPDEFAVVKKAPLIVPPDYSLRPPRPGAPRPQELQPTETARRAMMGEVGDDTNDMPTTGEMSLLKNAGADIVDPNIRTVINDESGRLREKDESFADTVLFWRDDQPDELPDAVVEPIGEKERLMRNEQQGQAPTEGATPSVPTEKKGIFKRIGDIF